MAEIPPTAEVAPRATISEEEVSALLEKNVADGVRPHDMTAQRINRMQLPLLEVVSKTFAERAKGWQNDYMVDFNMAYNRYFRAPAKKA